MRISKGKEPSEPDFTVTGRTITAERFRGAVGNWTPGGNSSGCRPFRNWDAIPTIYAGPGTEGVLTNFSMEVSPDPPDTTSPIADPEPRPGVPPLQHRLVMSGTIYAVEGVETNVYFRNIFLAVNPDLYLFDVDCSKGHNFKNRWSFTPGKKDVGIHDWTLRVRNDSGIVAKKSFKLAVAPADAGKGKNISLLMVGDSITDVTTFPKRVRELFKKPGNPALTMVGTRPSPVKNGSMAHEGYAGWAWSTFLEKGPFIDPASGKLDVAY